MLMNKTFFEINKSSAESSLCELHHCYDYSIQVTPVTFPHSGLVCTLSLLRYSCTSRDPAGDAADTSRISPWRDAELCGSELPLPSRCWHPDAGRGRGCSLAEPARLRNEKLTTASRICLGSLHTKRLPGPHVGAARY